MFKEKLKKENASQVLFGVVMMWLAAKVIIPAYPVNFTMQPIAAAFIVAMFGGSAFKSMSVYMLLGLVGVPVFTSGSGYDYLFFGASSGFLMGMWLSSVLYSRLNINYVYKYLLTILTIYMIGLNMWSLTGFEMYHILKYLPGEFLKFAIFYFGSKKLNMA